MPKHSSASLWHRAISVAFVGVLGLFASGNFNTIRETVPSVFRLTGTLTIYTAPLISKTHQKSNNTHDKCGK